MFKMWLQIALGLSVIIFAAYCGLEIIPERAKLVSFNEKYFSNFSLNIRRYSRTGAHYFNLEMTLKKSWNNNVSIHIIFNEHLHNEYRRSFIEFRHKFCDLVDYDNFIGPVVKLIGFDCPMPASTMRVINYTFPFDKFPNVFPFQKCRVDSELSITATNESMALMYHYVTFKNRKN